MAENKKFSKIVIDGQPIPAKRVTGRCLWRAKAYADYKEAAAYIIKGYGLATIEGNCSLHSVSFYRQGNRRADIDNLLKSIMEALQMSGLVKNDSQVVNIGKLSVSYGHANPRVEIEI